MISFQLISQAKPKGWASENFNKRTMKIGLGVEAG